MFYVFSSVGHWLLRYLVNGLMVVTNISCLECKKMREQIFLISDLTAPSLAMSRFGFSFAELACGSVRISNFYYLGYWAAKLLKMMVRMGKVVSD